MFKKFPDIVLYWDHVIWYYINTRWHTSFLDTVVPFLRNQWTWVPLYLFLALFIPSVFGRKGFIWCAFFIISFAISDQLSAHLMKPIFQRPRPCNTPYLEPIIRVLVNCGSGYSFPSSHASNHFAISIFSAVTLHRFARWIWWPAIIWAVLVSFAQVYVGVHFPLDVTCGGIVGTLTGIFTGNLFNKLFPLSRNDSESSPIAG